MELLCTIKQKIIQEVLHIQAQLLIVVTLIIKLFNNIMERYNIMGQLITMDR
jgi:hypothetical protein